jgi:hypothetical protein
MAAFCLSDGGLTREAMNELNMSSQILSGAEISQPFTPFDNSLERVARTEEGDGLVAIESLTVEAMSAFLNVDPNRKRHNVSLEYAILDLPTDAIVAKNEAELERALTGLRRKEYMKSAAVGALKIGLGMGATIAGCMITELLRDDGIVRYVPLVVGALYGLKSIVVGEVQFSRNIDKLKKEKMNAKARKPRRSSEPQNSYDNTYDDREEGEDWK